MHKKSQATIFMVLGLGIIVLGAIFLYYQRISITEGEITDAGVAPIQSFVGNCIEKEAIEAITILGINGGYIDFPLRVKSNPRSYLQTGPASNVKNPYWWFDGKSAIPTEEFIIRQLENNIKEDLKTCINGFESFEPEFKVRELGEMEIKVALNENDVVVDAIFPIDVLKRENKTRVRFEKFSRTIPIRLKKAYEFAKQIMEAENRDNFLEKKTIDLIVLDPDIPTTDIEATCEEKIWVFKDIEEKLKELLRFNLAYLRVLGSNYAENIFVSNPFGENTYKNSYYQFHYVWETADKKFSDFNAAFIFNKNFPFRMEARPRDGNILRSMPQRGFDLLNFLCLHIWHFTYDVVYPVQVRIRDENPDYRPFSFTFAFEVSIDHNKPNRKKFATEIFNEIERPSTEEFCSDLSNEITIYTVSNTTNGLVDITDVDLTLTCGPYTCDLGKSDWLSLGATSGVSKKTPYCVAAILRGKKDGFLDGQTIIQTDRGRAYTLYMKPFKEFNDYEVVKHPYDNPSSQSALKEGERASIQIEATQGSHETFGIYPSETNFPIRLLAEETEYDITIFLSDDDKLLGGYQQKWTVNPQKGEKIIFHVLDHGKASDDERALFIAGLESYSESIPRPEIK